MSLTYQWSRPDRYFKGLCTNLLMAETSVLDTCDLCIVPVEPTPPETEPAEDIAYVAIGTVASGTGNVTPGLPTGWAEHDLFLLFVETANEAVSAPAGYAQVSSSPQGTGTAGGSSSTRLTVFWKRATASESAPTVADAGDHTIACILALRGVTRIQDPFDVISGAVEASSTATGTIPGMTTTVTNAWVIIGSAYHQTLNLIPPLRFCDIVNSNLSSISVKTDATYAVGNGGGLAIATSLKATAGATGNTTVEWNQASTPTAGFHGMMMLAIIPRGQ